jgi:hypothetical protein
MGLAKTERLRSDMSIGAKLLAVLFLGVACALFGASLLTPQSALVGIEGRLSAGTVSRD